MIDILTSSLGGSYKVDGKRVPTFLLNENGLTEKIKHFWKNDSKVLIISADRKSLIEMIVSCIAKGKHLQ